MSNNNWIMLGKKLINLDRVDAVESLDIDGPQIEIERFGAEIASGEGLILELFNFKSKKARDAAFKAISDLLIDRIGDGERCFAATKAILPSGYRGAPQLDDEGREIGDNMAGAIDHLIGLGELMAESVAEQAKSHQEMAATIGNYMVEDQEMRMKAAAAELQSLIDEANALHRASESREAETKAKEAEVRARHPYGGKLIELAYLLETVADKCKGAPPSEENPGFNQPSMDAAMLINGLNDHGEDEYRLDEAHYLWGQIQGYKPSKRSKAYKEAKALIAELPAPSRTAAAE